MSDITSLYVHKVLGHVSAGVETGDLLEDLGLAPDGTVDPKLMVSANQFYDFFAALAARDPDGLSLPTRIGATMKTDEYGAFGLAWKSAPNLRGSLMRSERFGRVMGSAESYTLQECDEGWFFSLDKAGDGRLGMLLSNEASMSAVMTICQEVSTQPFQQLAVYFQHPARGDPAVYQAHFGCPVHFESGRDALLISDQSLSVPNRLGDETIAQFFDQHLEQELAKLAEPESLEKRVRLAVAKMLSEGLPTLSLIASSLGMNARTLQRRLSDQEQSFQNLVDQARRELAQQLLRETDYSLAEIAFLTGFAEQSGFTRAFKRWSGKTPRSYRIGTQRQM
ncbi:MAG: AraC family transcriptional regulator ligand-binding domain-containing protein [Sphingorhabdus sp.]